VTQNFNISVIPKFRQKVIHHLKNLLNLIDCTSNQKEIIWLKSIKTLDEFISRVQSKEFYIRKDVNLKAIAGTIIYTVICSNKDMPKITMNQISTLAKTFDSITSKFYKKYFKHLYPRLNFLFSAFQGFKRIRNIISLHIFKLIKDREVEI